MENIQTGKICSWPRMGLASRPKWWAIHNRMHIRSSTSRVRSILWVLLHWKLSSRSRLLNNTTDNASRIPMWLFKQSASRTTRSISKKTQFLFKCITNPRLRRVYCTNWLRSVRNDRRQLQLSTGCTNSICNNHPLVAYIQQDLIRSSKKFNTNTSLAAEMY
jgi:hypothetical protein